MKSGNRIIKKIVCFLSLSAWVVVSSLQPASAQLYQKEESVEIMTSAGQQSGGAYKVTGAFAQTAPATSSSSGTSNQVYPGYIPNLHSRVIVGYGLGLQDTAADTDADDNTQVAGIYFPLTIVAYDGFGYTAKSDSGSKLYLVTNTDKLKLDTNSDESFEDVYLILSQGSAPALAYSSKSDTDMWFKLTDARNLASNIELLNIKPAWITEYSITNTSPQRQGEFWRETVSAYDAFGNQVTDVSHLAGHASPTFTLTLPSSYSGRPTEDPLKFYLQTSSEGDNPLQYSYGVGSSSVYLKDDQAETVEIGITGTVHDYTAGSYSGVDSVQRSFTSGPIQILGWGYELMANINYNQSSNVLYVSAWLENEGSIVNPGSSGSSSVNIYDSAGNNLQSLSDNTADSSGIYHFQWSNQLTQTNYSARIQLTYNNITYQKDFSFTVEPDITLVESIEQSLQVKLTEDETVLNQEVVEAKQNVVDKAGDIEDDLDQVLVAGEKTIPAELTSNLGSEGLIPLAGVGIFNTPTYVLKGKELVVNFQTHPSVSPYLDVYDPKGALFIGKQAMQALTETGVYQTSVTFDSGASKGSYTLVCSESTYGTMDAISVEVVSVSLEKISQDMSGVLGTVGSIQNLKSTQTQLQNTFNTMELKMEELIADVVLLSVEYLSQTLRSELVTQRKQAMQTVFDGLADIQEEFGETGLFPGEMVEEIFSLHDEGVLDIIYLQNKMNAAAALLKMVHGLMDNLVNVPVQEYWFEFR